MLDQETKRKIDNARDILVGKVPDPKSQVEQITIALIYKFMDDMDKDSEALGGKATFFTGEFEKYAWPKIVDTKIGGQERLNLYGEAITQLNHNRNIPQLFRDIFKNAFLPYRDPETLNMFLKEINSFHYDHSENLGDAYEYLLAVLGSQGEAGQFRTPRHIIDFMVNVVEPKKHETILDPACGTAGFLISSYNYILRENTKERKGDQLTPDERKRLMNNLAGYDISPDMVRISLVNMYLHGFPNPMIHEYDTLTSEDRWQETYDVVLANPPFMTPKGGIRPHKRFSVKANRSEVLFVDYIAEHIATNGRAGVIVPEGIIFQSATAYKALRKMLVDGGHLYAVVSLPAGVFNPYSGVKTSILFMDKVLAKRTQTILFVKVENDGFDLGAQRRTIDKDDLPRALEVLLKYKRSLQEGKEAEFTEEEKQVAHAVPKARIGEKGEYNLTGERYKETIVHRQVKWPIVLLNTVITTITPPKKLQTSDFKPCGKYPIIDQSQSDISGWSNDEDAVIDSGLPFVIFGDHTCSVKYIERPFIQGADGIKILAPCEKLVAKYLYFILKANPIESDGYKRHFAKLKEMKIPLPPLEVQQEIVVEIESYQKIIDGAKQIVDNWKPKIQVDEAWPSIELGEACDIVSGGTPSTGVREYYDGGNIAWLGSSVCKDDIVTDITDYITEAGLSNCSAKLLKPNSTLIALVGATIGKTAFLPFQATTNQNIAGLFPKDTDKLAPKFLFYISQTLYNQFIQLGSGKFRMANLSFVRSLKVPLPSLEIQKQLVAQIEEEQKIVEANKKLIEIYEGKIKAKIAGVWGKECQ